MRRTFAFGACTSQGAWPVQEDGFYADPVRGFFALADGFGGRGSGDIAAKNALEELRAEKTGSEAQKIRESFLEAHRKISTRNQSRAPAARGGCSLLAASISAAGKVSLTQCGACVALLVRGGRIIPLLLPQAAPREEFQPLLPDQALGLPEGPTPEQRFFTLEAGDILVLGSSGIEWESESFQTELISQLSVRSAGSDLSHGASFVVENSSLASQSWNRTLLLVERISS